MPADTSPPTAVARCTQKPPGHLPVIEQRERSPQLENICLMNCKKRRNRKSSKSEDGTGRSFSESEELSSSNSSLFGSYHHLSTNELSSEDSKDWSRGDMILKHSNFDGTEKKDDENNDDISTKSGDTDSSSKSSTHEPSILANTSTSEYTDSSDDSNQINIEKSDREHSQNESEVESDSTNSTTFQLPIELELNDDQQDSKNIMKLNSKYVTPVALEAILTFLYTDKLDVTCQQIAQVHMSACFLEIPKAMEKCRQVCDMSSGCVKNSVFLYATACQLGLEIPKKRALDSMALCFESMLFENDYLELTEKQLEELLNVDTLGCRSEILVFLAALKWLNHEYLEREQHIVNMMTCVRFDAMSPEEAMSCFHPPILMGLVKLPEVQNMLLNAVCYITSKAAGKESLFQELQSRPRRLLLSGKQLELWDLSVFHPDWHRSRAAAVIQAAFRGYRTRSVLEASLWELYTTFRHRFDFNQTVRQQEAMKHNACRD